MEGGGKKQRKKMKEGKKEGIKRDRERKKKKLLICDSGQVSSSYPRRKYAIVGHCFVLY